MNKPSPVILLIGTADTKGDELLYLRERIEAAGASTLMMDVGILEPARFTPEISNDQVALAGGSTLTQLQMDGQESRAIQAMASGAARLAQRWFAQHRFDGILALGGSMGTDLALEVANALPPGVPKVVLSTIAHSHLIAPQRVPPDLIMILWAGGLYGLNPVCRSALSQAAGAAVGACQMAEPVGDARPLIGVTSFGTSCLRYIVRLKPALEARGFDVAVFHTTGMGGRAFESLAHKKLFAAVFDFSLQEISNHLGGSCVTAGPDRQTAAGSAGVPQIVAPGAVDMIDFPAWAPPPPGFEDRPGHVHNRLIASATLDSAQRAQVAQVIAQRLRGAASPTCLMIPRRGLHAWDVEGGPMHDPQGLQSFLNAIESATADLDVVTIDAHINDDAFVDAALERFDHWVARGII